MIINLIKTFILAIKQQMSTGYMILIVARFLLQEIYILMKLTIITEEILIPKILLMMTSSIRKILSFFQISQILWMSTSQFVSLQLFLKKVLKLTLILMSELRDSSFFSDVLDLIRDKVYHKKDATLNDQLRRKTEE